MTHIWDSLCQMVWTSICSAPGPGSGRISDLFSGSPLADAGIIAGRIVGRSPISLESWTWLQQQVDECLKGHRLRCLFNQVFAIPTRVIDVGPADGSQQPRLHVTEGELGQWIALSHCCGSEAHFVTDSLNYQDRGGLIAMETMPPTFRDAVTVTRMLGFRFLWIDSLCILQDNLEDWEVESSKCINSTRTPLWPSPPKVLEGSWGLSTLRPNVPTSYDHGSNDNEQSLRAPTPCICAVNDELELFRRRSNPTQLSSMDVRREDPVSKDHPFHANRACMGVRDRDGYRVVPFSFP